MSGWNISPQSVSSIITSEQTEVDEVLNPALTGIGTAQEGIFTATQTEAPLVASAISEWSTSHESEFTSMSTTISNVLTNTTYAVDAYLQQDEEAALEYQRQAK